MDRFGALNTFVAVARLGSFSEAARSLRISPTSASRAIQDLETTLGVALLRRTTRSVTLTPEGAAYLERCRQALDELEDAERSLRGEAAEPHGKLRLTSSELFGRRHIVPIVVSLMKAHPTLEVELVITNRLVKLVEDGVDIAVRIAELSDSAMHAVRVAEVHRVLVASPDYLARRGVPVSVADLRGHEQIMYDNFAPNGEWRFGPDGRAVARLEPRLTTNNCPAAIEAAIAGVGITRALCYQTVAHVEAGRLRYLLQDQTPPAVPVSLVFQANRRTSPNVRAFIDAAKAYFNPAMFGCPLHGVAEGVETDHAVGG